LYLFSVDEAVLVEKVEYFFLFFCCVGECHRFLGRGDILAHHTKLTIYRD
jgi:hypothetical protein